MPSKKVRERDPVVTGWVGVSQMFETRVGGWIHRRDLVSGIHGSSHGFRIHSALHLGNNFVRAGASKLPKFIRICYR
jgi:hypothetical protein